MTTFRSDNEARKTAEKIANTTQVFFTNDGLEITFTNETTNQNKIVSELKKVFTNVKLKGRKVPSIIINRLSQKTNGRFTITEVTY